MVATTVAPEHEAGTRARPVSRNRFMATMSWVLLGIVVIGFSPTFYLRPFFPVPPIPLYLYAHGVVLTCWFLLLVVQASLVPAGRTALHRRLGVLGIVLALLIAPPAVWLTLRFPGRILAVSGAPRQVVLPILAEGVAAGLIAASFSSVFLAAAFLNYKRPQLHRRFIVLASIAMAMAAFTRIGSFPVLGLSKPHLVTFGGTLLLVGAMWMHEGRMRQAIHPAWLWGGSSLLLALVLEMTVLPKARAFLAFVDSLL